MITDSRKKVTLSPQALTPKAFSTHNPILYHNLACSLFLLFLLFTSSAFFLFLGFPRGWFCFRLQAQKENSITYKSNKPRISYFLFSHQKQPSPDLVCSFETPESELISTVCRFRGLFIFAL